jgi:hypothetical protein
MTARNKRAYDFGRRHDGNQKLKRNEGKTYKRYEEIVRKQKKLTSLRLCEKSWQAMKKHNSESSSVMASGSSITR